MDAPDKEDAKCSNPLSSYLFKQCKWPLFWPGNVSPIFIVLLWDLRNFYKSVLQWILTLFICMINGFNDNTEFYLIVLHLQKPGGVIALLDEAWYA